MILLLPDEAGGLADLESRLTPDSLAAWTGGLQEVEIPIYLPRFSFTSRFDLKAALSDLGMPSAFADGQADFSGMDGSHDISIGAVIHQAFVLVNEEGTEAAAATVVIGPTSAPVSEFRADHPFLFLIRDAQTGSLLFLGRVADPRTP